MPSDITYTALAALVLLGCPGGGQSAPPKACAKAYEKCMLETGVLGVCDVVECKPSQTEPCLICRSQH